MDVCVVICSVRFASELDSRIESVDSKVKSIYCESIRLQEAEHESEVNAWLRKPRAVPSHVDTSTKLLSRPGRSFSLPGPWRPPRVAPVQYQPLSRSVVSSTSRLKRDIAELHQMRNALAKRQCHDSRDQLTADESFDHEDVAGQSSVAGSEGDAGNMATVLEEFDSKCQDIERSVRNLKSNLITRRHSSPACIRSLRPSLSDMDKRIAEVERDVQIVGARVFQLREVSQENNLFEWIRSARKTPEQKEIRKGSLPFAEKSIDMNPLLEHQINILKLDLHAMKSARAGMTVQSSNSDDSDTFELYCLRQDRVVALLHKLEARCKHIKTLLRKSEDLSGSDGAETLMEIKQFSLHCNEICFDYSNYIYYEGTSVQRFANMKRNATEPSIILYVS